MRKLATSTIHVSNILGNLLNSSLIRFFFKQPTMHVKISDRGRKVINDKELASQLVMTIVNNKEKLEKGEVVPIDNKHIGVKFVTTVKEVKTNP